MGIMMVNILLLMIMKIYIFTMIEVVMNLMLIIILMVILKFINNIKSVDGKAVVPECSFQRAAVWCEAAGIPR